MIVKFTDFNHEVMRKKSQEALKLVRVLSNENRLLLLCQLSKGEMSVTELEEYLGIYQPTLSQQLGILRSEGLVNTRRDGKRIYYSIADEKALAVLSTLCGLYCQDEKNP